ncbi:MAG TPA: haloacid dehalogenase type II [Gemmatimonadaceae bacterium]|nr:haloacid dehalogenase type II [Gemmatimonadaceae bacterium]
MTLDRREFLQLSAGGLVAGKVLSHRDALFPERAKYRAIAFDAFPIFDPRPVFALAEALFPGRGTALSNVWRARQFEYQWLRTAAHQYADFLQTTEEALVFAAKQVQIGLTPDARAQLMHAFMTLEAWPDARPTLSALKAAGLRLAFLSNMTAAMLHAGIEKAGLDGLFEHVLSTDARKTYKPDPLAYQMAVDAWKLRREEIVFVSFAAWDASGAKWFGYPTVLVNRLDAPLEELGVAPDAVGRDLSVVARFVGVAR